MRICLALLRSSPTVASFVEFVHVEALLLLPRNQGIRQRFKALFQRYCLIHFDRSDPYSEDGDLADSHPEVVAALRPILAIEVMLTDGRHQAALANYREAFLRGDDEEVERIEDNIAAIMELQPDRRADGSLHAVG